jgi:molybdate transport system substrate-binding protein
LRRYGRLLFIALFLLVVSLLNAQEIITVAAAANLSYLADPLKAAFSEKNPSMKVEFIFGASGALTTQITQGAPYDVFMSADTDFPQRLSDAGLSVAPPKIYAIGSLALFSIHKLDFTKGLAVLRDSAVTTIAIANPTTAPYGKASMEAIDKAGLQDIQSKIVFSQTISQAVQFALTSATAAFINQSALYTKDLASYATEGVYWIRIDPSLYSPIRQAFVLLKGAPNPTGARAFADFLLSVEAQALFTRFGYLKP